MPALEWITVEGFRSLKSVEKLQLQNINVIIGSNGSGKSNFVGVFSFLNAIREGRLKEYVARAGGANSILHFGSKITSHIHIHASFSDDVNQYAITLLPTESDELVPFDEIVYYWNKGRYPTPYNKALQGIGSEAAISSPQSAAIAKYVRDHLQKWRVYHFHDTSRTSPMKQMSDVEDSRFLKPDGSNLAAFLYMLKEKYPDEYAVITKTVQKVAPFFEDFVLFPSPLNEEKIRLEWRHKGSDDYFTAASLSDGSIRFIALATLLLQPADLCPSIVLIDEPELGLHPFALTVLSSMIKTASVDTQIIVSTQSALLLDHFQPSDVLVADRVDNGTQFRRLSDEQLSEWLEDYSLGQLWEKAEFGGRPSSGMERR